MKFIKFLLILLFLSLILNITIAEDDDSHNGDGDEDGSSSEGDSDAVAPSPYNGNGGMNGNGMGNNAYPSPPASPPADDESHSGSDSDGDGDSDSSNSESSSSSDNGEDDNGGNGEHGDMNKEEETPNNNDKTYSMCGEEGQECCSGEDKTPCNEPLSCDYNRDEDLVCVNRRVDTGRVEIEALGDNAALGSETDGTTTVTTVTIISIFTGLVFLIISLWYFCHKRGKHYVFPFSDSDSKGRHSAIGVADDELYENELDEIDNGDGIKITAIGGNDNDDSLDGNATQVIIDDNDNEENSAEIDIIYDNGDGELFNPNEHQTEGNLDDEDDENMTLNGANRV
mmetsp:Transcript_48466/g.43434  ORF Transcript_48466/g.43434 Transcript_48466/m.43434 type:complete len:341 (-) Transcript_48466:18-1040(-)